MSLEQYRATFDFMIQSVPMVTPDKSLRGKVIAKIQETNRKPLSGGQSGIRRKNFKEVIDSLVSTPARLAILVSMAALIVILAFNNLALYRQVNDLKVFMPGSDIHIIRLQATDDAPNAIGYLMVFSDGKAGTLAVKEAPVLDSGFQYQVWLIQEGQGVSGGMFNVNENGFGTLEINSKLPLDDFDTLDITKEPRGGSPAPTGGKILIGNF